MESFSSDSQCKARYLLGKLRSLLDKECRPIVCNTHILNYSFWRSFRQYQCLNNYCDLGKTRVTILFAVIISSHLQYPAQLDRRTRQTNVGQTPTECADLMLTPAKMAITWNGFHFPRSSKLPLIREWGGVKSNPWSLVQQTVMIIVGLATVGTWQTKSQKSTMKHHGRNSR